MNSMSKQKKSAIIAVAIAVVLIIAALVCWASFRPQALEGVKSITVNVYHSNVAEPVTQEIDTTAKYLLDALESYVALEGEESEYGLFVTSVDGEIADASLNEYWMFNVNGEMAEYGVETQPVSDGDTYSFYIYEYTAE